MKKALWVCFSVTLFLFFIFTADSKADEAVQQAPTDPDQAKEALKEKPSQLILDLTEHLHA